MAVRLDKAWQPLGQQQLAKVGGHLGIYQLGNDNGDILYIGVAGGRSRFGLKGELSEHFQSATCTATCFRIEVNMSYHTRHLELLQAYVHDHGQLPPLNTDIELTSLGRLRPGG